MSEGLALYDKHDGALSGDSTHLLSIIATHFGDSVPKMLGAEIGVHKGWLSSHLLRKFPQLTLYMIDPWMVYSPESVYGRSVDGCAGMNTKTHADAMERAVRLTEFAADRRVIMRQTSVDAGNVVADACLHWAFIDACHAYPSVVEDIDIWWPKVLPGGFLSGHDFGTGQNKMRQWGVDQAVQEFMERTNLPFHLKGHCWWIVKP